MGAATLDVKSEFKQIKGRIRDVLHRAYEPEVAVRVEEGETGKAFVTIVSDKFDGRDEGEKQREIWGILRDKMGDDAREVAVVLALGWIRCDKVGSL